MKSRSLFTEYTFFLVCVVVLLGTLAFAKQCDAQQRDTIYQQLFDGPITTAPETSAVFYAIGQTQHKVNIRLADGGGTCVGGFVDIFLEGSENGEVGSYVTIGNPVTNISTNQYGQLVATVIADIAMPFVRLVVNSFDTANCSLSAFYSGTLSPTSDPQVPLFYEIFSASQDIVLPVTSTIVDTKGYTQHVAYIELSDSCTLFQGWMRLQGAFNADGPWINIGSPVVPTTNDALVFPRAYGQFPLVRVYVNNAFLTNCTATVYYWGTTDAPDPFYTGTFGLFGTTRNSAGTSVILSGSATQFWEIIGYTVNAPCSGVTARLNIVGIGDVVNIQGPAVVHTPVNGFVQASTVAGVGNDVSLITTGTGCEVSARLSIRTQFP